MLKQGLAAFAGTSVLLIGAALPAVAEEGTGDPGAPSGAGVQPERVADNPNCTALLDESDFLFDYKLDPPKDVTVPLSQDGLTGQLTVDVDDLTVDFTLTGDFAAALVIVKGGNNANVYDYRPDGITADTGLHAPVNPKNGKYYGLSHITFCMVEVEEEPEPTPEPTPTTTTPAPTPTPTMTTPAPTPTKPTETKTPVPVPTAVTAGTSGTGGGSGPVVTLGIAALGVAVAAGVGSLVTRRKFTGI